MDFPVVHQASPGVWNLRLITHLAYPSTYTVLLLAKQNEIIAFYLHLRPLPHTGFTLRVRTTSLPPLRRNTPCILYVPGCSRPSQKILTCYFVRNLEGWIQAIPTMNITFNQVENQEKDALPTKLHLRLYRKRPIEPAAGLVTKATNVQTFLYLLTISFFILLLNVSIDSSPYSLLKLPGGWRKAIFNTPSVSTEILNLKNGNQHLHNI